MNFYPYAKAIHEQHLREAAKRQLYEELLRHNRPVRSQLQPGKPWSRIFNRLMLMRLTGLISALTQLRTRKLAFQPERSVRK